MKIALIYSHLKELGGAENVILNQFELLYKHGHDARCYFAYVDESQKRGTPNPHSYIESYLTPLLPNHKTVRIALSLPLAPLSFKTFRNFDVLLCHGYGPAPWIGYVLKKIQRKSYVSYIHSPPRFLYLEKEDRNRWRFDGTRDSILLLSKLTSPLLKELDYQGVVNSDKVLVNSYFTARRVKAIYKVKPKICYPPIDTSIFKPLPKRITDKTCAKFGWPLILSTGRIVAVKRWEWLIEMMPQIKKSFPSATLAITGEISYENLQYVQRLQKLAKSLGVSENVKFLGYKSLNALVNLYNSADAYAYAVPREDFGLGPVEAMACGIPPIVWNDGAGPCETVMNGRTGFRAEPYSVDDFAEKTMKAIEFRKSKYANVLHDFVEQNFSFKKHFKVLSETLTRPDNA